MPMPMPAGWLVVGTLARMFLFLSGADQMLEKRPELVTATTSAVSLRESLFFVRRGESPFATDAFHQSPLVLGVHLAIDVLPLPASARHLVLCALFVAADVGVALLLRLVARAHLTVAEKVGWQRAMCRTLPRAHKYAPFAEGSWRTRMLAPANVPDTVAALYLLNPYAILTCGAKSSLIFHNLLAAAALGMATVGARLGRTAMFASALALALATQLSVFGAVLVLPVAIAAQQHTDHHRRGSSAPGGRRPSWASRACGGVLRGGAATMTVVLAWAGLSCLMLALTALALGSWEFVRQVYVWSFAMKSLRPNTGVFWYLFVEVFPRFDNYFLFLLHINPWMFLLPLALHFRRRPVVMLTLLGYTFALLKAFTTVGEVALPMAMMALHPSVLERMKRKLLLPLLIGIAFPSILMPVMWHLWIFPGSGNANFFYNQGLLYVLFHSLLFFEFFRASMRRDKAVQSAVKRCKTKR